jgi:hypothetical protein
MAFTSKSQLFPFGMFPDPATQQADVYKQVAPGFQDSPLVNQFLGTATPRPQMGPPRPQMGPPRPTTTPEAKDRSGLAYMLIALGGALRGDKNFIQNTMAIKDAQTEKERREAQKKRYQEFLKEIDPKSDLYTLAKSLGPEDLSTLAIENFKIKRAESKSQADLLATLDKEDRDEARQIRKEERAEEMQIKKEGREFKTQKDILEFQSKLQSTKTPVDIIKLDRLQKLKDKLDTDPTYTQEMFNQDASVLGVNEKFLTPDKTRFISEYMKQMRTMKSVSGQPLFSIEELKEDAERSYDAIYGPSIVDLGTIPQE